MNMSHEESELFSTTRVKEKEVEDFRVKHLKVVSQTLKEFSEDGIGIFSGYDL